jgi:hypothetical protein
MRGDALALPSRLPFLAALPAVELRKRGVLAADAALLRGRRWTVTPITAVAEAIDRVHALIRALGGEPVAGVVH